MSPEFKISGFTKSGHPRSPKDRLKSKWVQRCDHSHLTSPHRPPRQETQIKEDSNIITQSQVERHEAEEISVHDGMRDDQEQGPNTSGLDIRRKALSQTAFVRYSTMGMLERITPISPKHDISPRRMPLPGDLYNHDIDNEIPGSKVGEQSPPLYLPFLHPSPSGRVSDSGPYMFRSTLDGIGHPKNTAMDTSDCLSFSDSSLIQPSVEQSSLPRYKTVPRPSPLEITVPPSKETCNSAATASGKGMYPRTTAVAQGSGRQLLDDGLTILLKSPHWQNRANNMPLILGGKGPSQEEAAAAITALSRMAAIASLEAERKAVVQKLKEDQLFPRSPGGGRVSPALALSQPFEDDLKLWNGKRLNETERKIEQRLHVLRNNPTAKVDLSGRVSNYLSDLRREQAERVARAEFAAERREQKNLEFLGNRFKNPARLHKDGAPVDSQYALFNSSNGKPRNDAHTLPPGSQAYWSGVVALSQKLGRLGAVLKRRAEDRRELAEQKSAAIVIQRYFRGFRDREKLRRMRHDAARAAKLEAEREAAKALADSCQTVLAFLEFMVVRTGDKAASAMKGSVGQASTRQRNISMLRRMRLDVMMSQWCSVEERCMECSRKRILSNIIGEMPTSEIKQPANPAASMLKGMSKGREQVPASSFLDEETVDDHIQREAAAAAAKTLTTDRIITLELKPVPKPVKIAVLHSFMKQRRLAYIFLLGLYWKDKAHFRVLSREYHAKEDARRAALKALRGDNPEAEAAAAAAAAAAAPVDPGSMPRFRMLATLPEMKVLMQQGVAENPSFQAYLVRGGLQAYENQITRELTKSYTKRGTSSSGTGARAARSTDGGEADADIENPKSFTLTLLMHRWDRECKPRIAACLAKRVDQLYMSLTDALDRGLWLPSEDMGTKLMELRDG